MLSELMATMFRLCGVGLAILLFLVLVVLCIGILKELFWLFFEDE